MKALLVELFSSKPFQKRLAKFLVHPVTILAIATVAAVWLTNYYQHQAWVREKRFVIFEKDYQSALRLVDEVSDLMSRRFFGLNRVVWVAKGTGTGELDEVWDEYYQSVIEWNTKHLAYRGRLKRLISPLAAEVFGTWDDPALKDVETPPSSIHAAFFVAHKRVRELVDCVRQRCSSEAREAALQQAEQTLNELGVAMEKFVQACTASIHERAS